MKFQMARFGMAADPRGAQVTCEYDGRTLLGDVRDAYRDEWLGVTKLRVTHFNGDPWPIDPGVLDVEVLERR